MSRVGDKIDNRENKGGAEGLTDKDLEDLQRDSPHQDDDTGLGKMRTRV